MRSQSPAGPMDGGIEGSSPPADSTSRSRGPEFASSRGMVACEVAGRRAATGTTLSSRCAFPAGPSRTQQAPFSALRSPASLEVRAAVPLCDHIPGRQSLRAPHGAAVVDVSGPLHYADGTSPTPAARLTLPRASVPASCGLPRRLGRHRGYYGAPSPQSVGRARRP